MTEASAVANARELVLTLGRELKWKLLLPVATALGLAVTESAGLVLLVPLLEIIGLADEPGPASRLASWASRGFALAGIPLTLTSVLVVFLTVSVARALLSRAHLMLNPALEQQVAVRLRRRLYDAILSARWPFLVRRRTPDLVHAVTLDIDRVSGATYQLLNAMAGIAVSGVYLVIAARLSPALTVLVAASGAGVLWLLRGQTRRSTEGSETYASSGRALFAMASESIAGVKVAKSFGAEQRDMRIFGERATETSEGYLSMLRAYAGMRLRLDIASAVLVSVLLAVAVGPLGVRGAGLAVLVFIFARVMPRITALQEAAQIFVAGLPAFANVWSLIAECEAEAERVASSEGRRLALRSELRLHDVSFAYDVAGPDVLADVSLTIEAGSVTALAGTSGAGKSTVADLVMGLLTPSRGAILVDGRPLADEDRGPWRHSIGYVPQDPFLLHDTVKANLRWAVPGASDDEMWDALERAAAADFLRARPDGLDTVVGDRGIRLSGGERQRLALARALLVKPDLLILDEATSALDSANEQLILSAVQRLGPGTTVLIITHRLSTLRGANLVYVLANGRIVESGSWAALADRRDGVFRAMLDVQGVEI